MGGEAAEKVTEGRISCTTQEPRTSAKYSALSYWVSVAIPRYYSYGGPRCMSATSSRDLEFRVRRAICIYDHKKANDNADNSVGHRLNSLGIYANNDATTFRFSRPEQGDNL